MDTPDLLPCPFCGGDDVQYNVHRTFGGKWSWPSAICTACHTSIAIGGDYPTKDTALRAIRARWNGVREGADVKSGLHNCLNCRWLEEDTDALPVCACPRNIGDMGKDGQCAGFAWSEGKETEA
jgi:hypothetical protein